MLYLLPYIEIKYRTIHREVSKPPIILPVYFLLPFSGWSAPFPTLLGMNITNSFSTPFAPDLGCDCTSFRIPPFNFQGVNRLLMEKSTVIPKYKRDKYGQLLES